MKSVGIDIGSHSIKVVELTSGSKGQNITAFFQHKFSLNSQADHSIETIEFLRELTSRYDVSSTRFSIALRTDRVALRSKFFPFSERIKILKSLPFELEEDIPFSTDNAIFDAKVIRLIGNAAETISAAAPKHHIQSAIQMANDCGFTPSILTEEGLALANLTESWDEIPAISAPPHGLLDEVEKPAKTLSLVLNMGHTRTVLTVFEGTSVIAVRSLLWGGKNIIDAVAKKYSIPFIEAAREVETKSFILTNKQGASFDQVSFSDTIASAVREMVRDLQLSLLELKAEHNATFKEAHITGGASQVINLGAFLTQMLEIPVNKLDTQARFPNSLVEKSASNQAIMGLALGLAIDATKKPRNPALNFLRGEFAIENHNFKNFMNQWTPTFKVLGGFVVVLFAYTMLRESFALDLADRTTEALKDQAKQSAGLKGKKANETAIKKFIKEKRRIANELKALEGLTTMNSAMDVFNKVSTTAPAKGAITMDVQKLAIQDDTVYMEGYVKSPKEATLLQQALSNLSTNGKVVTQRASLKTLTDKTSFAYSFTVDREISKENR